MTEFKSRDAEYLLQLAAVFDQTERKDAVMRLKLIAARIELHEKQFNEALSQVIEAIASDPAREAVEHE